MRKTEGDWRCYQMPEKKTSRCIFVSAIFQKGFASFVKLLVGHRFNLNYKPRHIYFTIWSVSWNIGLYPKKEFQFLRTECTEIMYISEVILMYIPCFTNDFWLFQVIHVRRTSNSNLCFSPKEKSKPQKQNFHNVWPSKNRLKHN